MSLEEGGFVCDHLDQYSRIARRLDLGGPSDGILFFSRGKGTVGVFEKPSTEVVKDTCMCRYLWRRLSVALAYTLGETRRTSS